jgi:transcriptional regulator with XRE-family HTH domain
MSEFQKRLQKLRERRGISRVVLSQLCGFADGQIRLYERGEQEPTMRSLMSMADVLGVSMDYLSGRTEK